jgi:CheY-like chemotaxis protein
VLRVKATDKKLGFNLEIDDKLNHTVIKSDPTRLSQLMYNLVSNAIKFTENGSITVRLVNTYTSGNSVRILFSIADTGIGIHQDRHNTIFEMFSQAESHITRKYGGSGLGLAIVKQVLQLFGSTIKMQSTPGEGTTFSFEIDFEIAVAPIKDIAEQQLSLTDITNLRILVAEDNDVNRLIIKKQLDTLHVKADLVENGKIALEHCKANKYDAIFMDLHMPVMDGFEATKQIRASSSQTAAQNYIIAFTASVTEQDKIAESGFNDFLYKPVNMKDLREKLQKIAEMKV